MATYMLCGFANFASIGIQIGGIGSLAPGQRKLLSKFGMRALLGGTIASLISATIAGMIIGWASHLNPLSKGKRTFSQLINY